VYIRAVAVGAFLGLIFISPLVFVYFLVIKGVDRYEPEPLWLLTVMFFWGALGATAVAIVGDQIGMNAISAALGMGAQTSLVDASTASFVAPLVEESAKGVGLLALWGASALFLNEIDGALDGAIYGGVIGLGFTLTEDLMYVSSAAAKGGVDAFATVFVMRTVLNGLGHASFTAMTGLGVGIANETRSPVLKIGAPVGGWMCAVGLHGLHNFLVTFLMDGGTGLVVKYLLFWTFDLFFFVLLFALAARDRVIVLRGLVEEVGRLLHPKELRLTTSYGMFVPLWNVFALMRSPGGYWKSRRKQLDLVELAFVKNRRRRGESGSGLDQREQRLRTAIAVANQRGVFIGAR
jgi:protease PrsW